MPPGKMTKNQIKDLIREINRRYKIGQQILAQCGDWSPPGRIAKLAKQKRINRDVAQKLRAIASHETGGYTKAELNGWFDRFRAARYALTISHFIKLVSVPKGPDRDRLTQRAIDEQLSSHRVQAEILALQGRRRQGGRRPVLASREQFQDKFRQQLWSWQRWLKLHQEMTKGLNRNLRGQVESLLASMEAMSELFEAESKPGKSGRKSRGG